MINSCIYNGNVIHKRFKPKEHFFKYKVFSLFIDLSELNELNDKLKFFSLNKFNLISFYEKDHGDRDGSSLFEWVKKNEIEKNSITYWLNLLQNLKCEENIFLTLNPYFEIDSSKVLKKVKFTHPYFDQSALTYQNRLKNLQNKRNILFCGSYFGYGFHEDGIKSSIEMLKYLDD